jgi:hypothetical protein
LRRHASGRIHAADEQRIMVLPMARSRLAPRREPMRRKASEPSAADVANRQEVLMQFLENNRRPAPAPIQEQPTTRREKPFSATHCVVFNKARGAERMERAAAKAAVQRDPLTYSFDPWADGTDAGSAHEIPWDWQELPERELRELHARMQLPRGSKWGCGQSGSHISFIKYDVERRFARRESVAMGLAR